jgi:Icc-related predicted phosphoesterase
VGSGLSMRLLYASDFHGSTRAWRKLLNAVAVYKADAVLVGGDLTGKAVVPIVRRNVGWSARFLGTAVRMDTAAERDELAVRITDSGLYPYETDQDELAVLGGDKPAADRIFERLMNERLQSWVDLAAERLDESVPLVVIPGNDDLPNMDQILNHAPRVTMAHDRVVDLGSLQVMGLGYSNMTPWRAPRDVPEDVIADSIERLVPQVTEFSRCIFLMHCPPQGTPLDECMAIDEQLRPIAGGTVMTHAGSTAVREAVQRYQPMVGLHGHIHESRGAVHLGKTLCINAGSEYSEGVLRAAIVEITGDEKVKHLFVTA